MDCAAIYDLVSAYALDSLEPDETADVRRHLAFCPACAAVSAQFERVATLITYLAPQVSPPPDVKAALFSRIAQTHTAQRTLPSPSIAARAFSVHAIPAPSATIPASQPSGPIPPSSTPVSAARRTRNRLGLPGLRASWSTPRTWRSYTLPVATTAIPLVLALAIVGGWAYSLYDDAANARDDQSFMGTFSSVLSGGNGNLYELTSAAELPDAEGQFLASLDGNDGILMVSGLNPGQSDQAYEVWIEQDGAMYRYSTLDVDRHGNGQMLIEVDGTFKRCRGVYIQLAPMDGNTGNRSDVLWTSLTTPGPANGGKQTEGDPEIGSSTVATVPLSSK